MRTVANAAIHCLVTGIVVTRLILFENHGLVDVMCLNLNAKKSTKQMFKTFLHFGKGIHKQRCSKCQYSSDLSGKLSAVIRNFSFTWAAESVGKRPWQQSSWGQHGPTWGLHDPGRPHDGPMNFAIWGVLNWKKNHVSNYCDNFAYVCIYPIVCHQLLAAWWSICLRENDMTRNSIKSAN